LLVHVNMATVDLLKTLPRLTGFTRCGERKENSMSVKVGAFPRQTIVELMEAGFIKGIDGKYLNSASLDLAVTEHIFRTPGVFLPMSGENVIDRLHKMELEEQDLTQPLERDVTYVTRVVGDFKLPRGVYGYCNPKSTTGRTDTHVRVIADGIPRYDTLAPAGWEGEIWLLITPKSMPVRFSSGQALAQLRLCNQNTKLSEVELQVAMEMYQLIWDRVGRPINYDDFKVSDGDGSVILTLGLFGDPVGWECTHPSKVFDFSAENDSLDPNDFFRPLSARNGCVNLERGKFYILATNEAVRVPPELACEMRPMDERSGEFRTHYAGFVDPGWGWGKEGEGKGRPLTLELRPYEDMTILAHQPVARIRFERMFEIPDVVYDAGKPSYSDQPGPRLARQFKV